MYRYRLEVLQDDGSDTRVFEIISPKMVDSRLLQLCGLVLDDGCSPELIRYEVATAQSYVYTDGTHKDKWVDSALKGEI